MPFLHGSIGKESGIGIVAGCPCQARADSEISTYSGDGALRAAQDGAGTAMRRWIQRLARTTTKNKNKTVEMAMAIVHA